MRQFKGQAILTTEAPLIHGTEKSRIKPIDLPQGVKNNYMPHRKLPFLIRRGDLTEMVSLPIVSGNSIRHKWRESLADVTLLILGLDKRELPVNVLEMFMNGGGMDSSDVEKNEGEEEKQEKQKRKKKALAPAYPVLVRNPDTLRAAVPLLSLFGCSYGNRMLQGALNVGIAMPALTQTEHLTGVPSEVSFSDELTTFQMFTRSDNTEKAAGEKSRQSIFYVESVAVGTPFQHTFSTSRLTTPLERSALQLALDLFKEQPYLGGNVAKGYGKVSTTQWYEPLDVDASLYVQWLKKNKDVLVEYIRIWNEPQKIVRMKGSTEELVYPDDLSVELDRLVNERKEQLRKEEGIMLKGLI